MDALHHAGDHVPELCLSATEGGAVVGHIVYSRARLASGHGVLALAPMAVLPECQRRGIGSRLVRESVDLACDTDYPMVVVLGHPSFYPRFGFRPAAGYDVVAPWEVPPEAWMVRLLPQYTPEARGPVAYPPAFGLVT